MKNENLLEMKSISKSFFETKALNNVDFACHAGEVHALVGLNGAGKSTLTKVLGGVIQRDEGEILLNGSPVAISRPSDANDIGIATIHQEYSTINELTVAANIFLGRELTIGKTPFLDKRRMAAEVRELLKRFGLEIDPRETVGNLNSGEKQIVEILRALATKSWLIVMDEPTSALSEEDKQKLFEFIRRMQDEGISIIYISHHMPEIFGIADRVTVMRDGKIVLSEKTGETSEDAVIREMTGEDLDDFIKPEKTVSSDKMLEVKDLNKPGQFRDINFTVARGEIVVMTGLRGCGAPEIAKSIFGLEKDYAGEITYRGQKLAKGQGPAWSVRHGMGFVSENRDKNGILAPLSVADNISLPFLYKNTKLGVIDGGAVNGIVDKAIRDTGTKTHSSATEIRFLSGGNKQKVCFSRWLDEDLELLILLEPTRGIDVHAKADIYRIIEDLAVRGVGILVLSYEVDEVLLLADRVLTLYQGDVVSEYGQSNMEKEMLLADMAGVQKSA